MESIGSKSVSLWTTYPESRFTREKEGGLSSNDTTVVNYQIQLYVSRVEGTQECLHRDTTETSTGSLSASIQFSWDVNCYNHNKYVGFIHVPRSSIMYLPRSLGCMDSVTLFFQKENSGRKYNIHTWTMLVQVNLITDHCGRPGQKLSNQWPKELASHTMP